MTRIPNGLMAEAAGETQGGHETTRTRRHSALSKKDLVEAFRIAYLSRKLDDVEIRLKRQQKIYFQISGAGHELPQICLGRQLRPGRDWVFPYYRDRALALTLGVSAEEILLQAVGAWRDPSSGGRQMPSHFGHAELRIVSSSSPTGTQFLHAAGAAQAGRLHEAIERLRHQTDRYDRDEVVLVCTGDGATSQGEFWEALNSAATLKLPLIFLVEDNGYAISVPVECQTPGGSISRAMSGIPNLKIVECDGCDIASTWEATSEVLEYVRAGKGPAMLHAHVVRPYSHSMSDDETKYKPPVEREREAERDPLVTLADHLVRERILTKRQLDELKESVEAEVEAAKDAALAAEPPPRHSATWFIYSPDVDPTSDAFDTAPHFQGGERTMVDLLNRTLFTEMERDPRIVVFGEDVADVSRDQYLGEVKGKGGVFTVTLGLQRAFGSQRVFNSPLAEANIIGRAIGMAVRGLKPVVEIQFFDYIWPAFMQLRNELATMRWRSNNAYKAPVVVRVPIGGYLKGGAPYHSQSGEVLFTHIPGLRVVMPSTAVDANGLLRTAIRSDDPVLFLEPKQLYRQTFNKAPDPGPDFMIRFGSARIVRQGSDLTMVTYGNLVHRSVRAAEQLAERDGIQVEVIDLRSLSPYDWPTISASVKKTSKAIVAHEDNLSFGFGAEIAARISDELFEYLDGPVKRVGAVDSFVAYHPDLEDVILPQTADLERAMRELAAY